MTNIPRPVLDEVTAWRIDQVAKVEGRSFSNALARMIGESWDHRVEARTRALMPAEAFDAYKAEVRRLTGTAA
jgi:hypothetical protein